MLRSAVTLRHASQSPRVRGMRGVREVIAGAALVGAFGGVGRHKRTGFNGATGQTVHE